MFDLAFPQTFITVSGQLERFVADYFPAPGAMFDLALPQTFITVTRQLE